jgi:hypothetical protein
MSISEEHWRETCEGLNGLSRESYAGAGQFKKTVQSVLWTIVLLCLVAIAIAAIL